MSLKEKLLIVRFNRGDAEAVHMIYDLYKGDLMALAASLLRNTAAAEDVVHDVFISFLKLRRFRLMGSLRGYLATCVANAARNVLRANHQHPGEPLDEADGVEATGLGPDGETMRSEESEIFSRAVQALPYEQREVVMLHLRGGLKFAEIADLRQASINTIQGRYRYGLEKVTASLTRLMAGQQNSLAAAARSRKALPPAPAIDREGQP